MFNQVEAGIPQKPAKVYVSGNQLFVAKVLKDGSQEKAKPYVIKGLTWTPATKAPHFGPDPSSPGSETKYGFFFDWPNRTPQGHEVLVYWLRSEFISNYKKDIALMKEMNVNTVRLYTPPGNGPEEYKEVLDEFYCKDIMVIMTVAMLKDDIDAQRYLNVVKACMNHPAILMWSLGNEWNLEYNKYWGYPSVADAARATNRVAQIIKSIDSNHPVASCLGDRFTDSDETATIEWIVKTCNEVDVWGLNIYRGRSFGNLFFQWSMISQKPFYLSEFGTDSFHTVQFKVVNGFQADECRGEQNQQQQAEFALGLWSEIEKHLSAIDPTQQCLGGIIHEFSDELWKVGSFHASLGDLVDYYSSEAHAYQEYNSQGYYLSGAHPDNIANEEYFGVVDADRVPKKAFWVLKEYYGR